MATQMNPKLNNILFKILATKRPTSQPLECFNFAHRLLDNLKIPYQVDDARNITVIVGAKPTTMFTAHTDTVEKHLGTNLLTVTDDGFVFNEGGILGADDGAGMYVLIRMIQAKKPGLYVFFSAEERGRIGSQQYVLPHHDIYHCISFDRKGTNELVTEQMGEPGCSQEFIEYFEKNFPLLYYADPSGVFTDSYTFFNDIPECVNLSVGYYNEHTKNEYLDFIFLESLVDACIKFDWTKLPVGQRQYFDTNQNEFENYIKNHPDIIVELLRTYGLTFRDVLDYEDSLYDFQIYP